MSGIQAEASDENNKSTKDDSEDINNKSVVYPDTQSSDPNNIEDCIPVERDHQRNIIIRHSSRSNLSNNPSPSASVTAATTNAMSPTIISATNSPPLVKFKRQYSAMNAINDISFGAADEERLAQLLEKPSKRFSAFSPYYASQASPNQENESKHSNLNLRDDNYERHESTSRITREQRPGPTTLVTITTANTAISTPNNNNSNISTGFGSKSSSSNSSMEKMCSLKWSGYELQIVDRLSNLYQSPEFTDVTLSCEGHEIKAHKLILAMCSPFFWKMFQDTPCKHPFVIVNGIKLGDLQRVIQFVYIGQVSLNEDEIDDFIEAAESLGIDGVNSSNGLSSPQEILEERFTSSTSTSSKAFFYSNVLHSHSHNESDSPANNRNTRRSISNENNNCNVLESNDKVRCHNEEDNEPEIVDDAGGLNQQNYETKAKIVQEHDEGVVPEDHYLSHPKDLKFHKYFRRYKGKTSEATISATASIESGPRISSNGSSADSTMSTQQHQRKDSVITTNSCFEEISPSTTPKSVEDGGHAHEGDKSTGVKRSRTNISTSSSPVDMSMNNSAVDPGPRLPRPPWYSPPSKSNASSPKSFSTTSPEEFKYLQHESHRSSISPIHAGPPIHVEGNVAVAVSNRTHHYRQSGHIYNSISGFHNKNNEGQRPIRTEDNVMKRSISLSPENQSYQLHLPDGNVANESYQGNMNMAMILSSSSRSIVETQRRWLNPPISLGRQRKQTAPAMYHSSSHARQGPSTHGPLSLPLQTSPQYLPSTSPGFSSSLYSYPALSQPSTGFGFYGSSSNTEMKTNARISGFDDFQRSLKSRTESTSVSTMSNLRMRLSGISPSSIGSIGSSGGTRASSSSSSASGISAAALERGNPYGSTGTNTGLSSTKPRTKAIRSCQVPQEFRYTAHEVDSMVEQVETYPGPLVPCAVCSKFVKRERLRAHIHECHLLQGEKIICQYCGIALKSKGSYRVHIWRHKRGNLPTKRFKSPQKSQ